MLCASQQVIFVKCANACHTCTCLSNAHLRTLDPRPDDVGSAKAVGAGAAGRRHRQARKAAAGRTEAGVLLDGDLLASYALLPAPRQAEVARRAGVSHEAALQAVHAAAAAVALF